MCLIRIYLFGKFEIRAGEQVVNRFLARKAQELLCYLLLHRERPHTREALADLLWTDGTVPQSKKYLRKTLWQLQSGLDVHLGQDNGHTLLVEPNWIELNPAVEYWLDVAVFEQAFIRVQGVPGEGLDAQSAHAVQDAVDLYRGELLENWYQDWCLRERMRLQNIYRALLDKLIAFCEAQRDYDAGLVYAARSLRCDPARERTHRQLMRLHYLAGDRTTALRQYEKCVEILKSELSVAPTERTAALYEAIRSDQLGRPVLTPVAASPLRKPIAAS